MTLERCCDEKARRFARRSFAPHEDEVGEEEDEEGEADPEVAPSQGLNEGRHGPHMGVEVHGGYEVLDVLAVRA